MTPRLALLVAGYVWSSPLGLLGLVVELAFRALGWVHFQSGRQQTVVGPLAERLMRRGWRGTTIGWSRFYWFTPVDRTVFHEERHVQQVLRWGVLLPLVYGAYLIVKGYRDNPFEVDARDYAGRKMQEGFERLLAEDAKKWVSGEA